MLFRRTLCEFLTEISCAAVGLQSIECLELHLRGGEVAFDLVVLQLSSEGVRPSMEALRRLHRLIPEAQLILLVAREPQLELDEALELGLSAVLREPVWLMELELVVLRLQRAALASVEDTAPRGRRLTQVAS